MNRQDGIHLDALAAALGETGDTALDIVRRGFRCPRS